MHPCNKSGYPEHPCIDQASMHPEHASMQLIQVKSRLRLEGRARMLSYVK